MSATVKPRKPPLPVSGSVKVLRPFGEVNDDTAEIAVNGKPCYLTRHETGYCLTGFDARKGKVSAYDLPLDLSSCDCPDATYRVREGGCKHQKALAALRTAGKL
jgi:hypothetical protein